MRTFNENYKATLQKENLKKACMLTDLIQNKGQKNTDTELTPRYSELRNKWLSVMKSNIEQC